MRRTQLALHDSGEMIATARDKGVKGSAEFDEAFMAKYEGTMHVLGTAYPAPFAKR